MPELNFDDRQPLSDWAVRVSVILAVRNGAEHLGRQMAALAAQDYCEPWEVIVVDNGSSDESGPLAESFADRVPRLRVLREETPGKARALNAGRDAAAGEYLVIVDADDEVEQNYLSAMAVALAKYDVVGGVMESRKLNGPWQREPSSPPDRLAIFLGFLPYSPGCCLAARATAWDELGGFDPTPGLAEDVDFTWRAQLAGLQIGFAPDAVVHISYPTDVRGTWRKARHYGRRHVNLYARYRSQGQPRKPLVEELVRLRRVVQDVLKRPPQWRTDVAWNCGLVMGRLEQSLRRRVWYP